VGSTGRCNTLGFPCCLDRRHGSGKAGSSWRVVVGGQEGAVEAVESRRVHQPHSPGTTEASRLPPRDARGYGGISPPERQRRRCALTPSEREEISRGLAAGESLRTIATRLGRCASTVCREVNRNGGRRNYRAQQADERACERARRPKRCLLATNHFLRDVVARKLHEDLSPEQISGWLKREYPSDEAMRISHETIYRTLFVQARGALKRELLAHLPEAEDRAVPGHWEGDLLAGSRNTHVATLVERSSRFVMLVRVDGKDTERWLGLLASR
jgi:IS30 family transposase